LRSRSVLAALAAAALVLPACGDGGDDATPETTPTATSTDGTDGAAAADAPSFEDGVAAVVNGEEIGAELLEERVELAAASPELAPLLEGEDGEAARAQLRASVLSQLIVNQLVLDGAESRGLEVDDAAVDETREELAAEAGGEEAFEDQVAQAGLDEDQLRAELEAVTALRLVRDDLQEETGAEDEPSPNPTEPSAGDALLQQWLLEQLTSADVAVAPEIGSWDQTQGTVVPAGAAGTTAPGGADVAPEETGSPAEEPAPTTASPSPAG
jgi:hypothetical protein